MSHSPAPQAATVLLKLATCDMCGVPFGVPVALFDHAVAFRATLCCPNGHVRFVTGDSPVERRIRQLEEQSVAQGLQLLAARAENVALRRTVVDRLVGPDTAPDPAS